MSFIKSAFGAIIGGAIGGPAGASIGAGIGGAADANSARKAEASKNRQFQQRNSDTAHQREVADLRAAGLNPILSATGGPGASTPSGSVAPIENTAKDVASNYSKTATIKAQLDNLKASTGLSEEQTKVQAEQINYIRAMTEGAKNSARATDLQNQMLEIESSFYARNPFFRILKELIPTAAIAGGGLGIGAAMGGRKKKPFNPLNDLDTKVQVGKKGKKR